MYLIAESGSTKTSWCTINDESVTRLTNTPGINPVLLKPDDIETIMRPVLAEIDTKLLDGIIYFGAGCVTNAQKQKIGNAIYNVFKAEKIMVDTDLIAACLALTGENPAAIGLLGTGSNSCIWNGSKVTLRTPSLGYILGDEGGGVSIGKQLVSDFLKNQMPLELRIKFIEKYDVSTDIVIERVYQMQQPNKYLAAFAPFAEAHITHPYCRSIIKNQFDAFIQRNILNYDNIEKYELHFCGSIAYHHRDILKEIVEQNNLKLGKIIKEPINEIAQYFLAHPPSFQD